ncbi:MAG: hypothetical protein RMK57_13985 [Bryobacterales bacterium]|nr:hypothetical protein [Bryobacteraceae bacterium]MDW8355630.1 hypothetical protein [Bryobacterales bacterium]
MKRTVLLTLLAFWSGAGQEPRIAVVGLIHSHVWGHSNKMIQGLPARLVGIAETRQDWIAEAKRRGAVGGVLRRLPPRALGSQAGHCLGLRGE